MLHQGEASILVTSYAALAITNDHALTLTWRVIDTRNGRNVVSGTSPVGTLRAGAVGRFASVIVAPNLLGTYRFAYELSENNVAVSDAWPKHDPLFARIVEVQGARTYPDDQGGRLVTPTGIQPTPAPSPRFQFPRITIPKPSLPIELPLLRGKTPSPPPAH